MPTTLRFDSQAKSYRICEIAQRRVANIGKSPAKRRIRGDPLLSGGSGRWPIARYLRGISRNAGGRLILFPDTVAANRRDYAGQRRKCTTFGEKRSAVRRPPPESGGPNRRLVMPLNRRLATPQSPQNRRLAVPQSPQNRW